ncbi:MAG: ABC-F family ATP-binding cassette domain-containing protein [Deltaproteobacteria bacterium]|nr:ABC-F family ATP-binding cassette domain-containing protein [Deltaproteobacteria bacterium]
MLQVSNLSKSFGSQVLFEGVSFGMTERERIGLVGRNGSGKSTLFKLILGLESPDSGSITVPRGYRIGHLEQHLKFSKDTVLEEACLGLPPDERELTYKAEIILDGLGFSPEDIHKPPTEFSGGFQIRINLAKLLLSEPNLLLLDEPTNYLDILSVRWLTEFLQDWQGELILISHDRLFMDQVTTHSMLIHRSAVKKIKGDTEKLYSQIQQDEEIYEKTRINEDKKRKQLEAFITRFRAQASKATLVQSKVKALERMGEKAELQDEASLDFSFCESPITAKQIGEVRDLSFGFENGPLLIEGLSFTIGRRDRIAVIGKNGKGKTTLLRLLAGELQASEGSIRFNQDAKLGYFGQTNISRLNPNMTVEEEIEQANPRLHRTRIRNIAGTMMFSGDSALKKVKVLSGGEKSRVLLAKILAQATNLLLLDEPTNHLDMDAIEALIESLDSYDGAVVIVTHSELILKKLATKLVIFHGNRPHVFLHDYDYFLEKEGWSDEPISAPTKHSREEKLPNENAPIERGKNPARSPQTLKRLIKGIEERIMECESRVAAAQQELAKCDPKDHVALAELSKQLKELNELIETDFIELEELSGELQGR